GGARTKSPHPIRVSAGGALRRHTSALFRLVWISHLGNGTDRRNRGPVRARPIASAYRPNPRLRHAERAETRANSIAMLFRATIANPGMEIVSSTGPGSAHRP